MDPVTVIDDKTKAAAAPSPAAKEAVAAEPERFASDDIPAMDAKEREHYQLTGELPKPKKDGASATPASPAAAAVDDKKGDDGKPANAGKPAEGGKPAEAQEPADGRRVEKPHEIRIKQLLAESKAATARAEAAEAKLKAPAKVEAVAVRPKPDDNDEKGQPKYPTMQDYVDALTKFEVTQALDSRSKADAETKAQAERAERIKTAQERWDKQATEARKAHKDFDEIIETLEVKPGGVLDAYLGNSERAAALHYHLAQNQAEAARIAKLNPIEQVREYAFLESKLGGAKSSAKPPDVSAAPPPAKDVSTTRGAAADPIKAAVENEDYAGYADAANQRDIKSRKG